MSTIITMVTFKIQRVATVTTLKNFHKLNLKLEYEFIIKNNFNIHAALAKRTISTVTISDKDGLNFQVT